MNRFNNFKLSNMLKSIFFMFVILMLGISKSFAQATDYDDFPPADSPIANWSVAGSTTLWSPTFTLNTAGPNDPGIGVTTTSNAELSCAANCSSSENVTLTWTNTGSTTFENYVSIDAFPQGSTNKTIEIFVSDGSTTVQAPSQDAFYCQSGNEFPGSTCVHSQWNTVFINLTSSGLANISSVQLVVVGVTNLDSQPIFFDYLRGSNINPVIIAGCNTPTPTNTPLATSTFTVTKTPTITNTPTNTSTPTSTFTLTPTFTPTPTVTLTSTVTPTFTYTLTNTPTTTPTATPTDTFTSTVTPTFTNTLTSTVTSTPTPTFPFTPTFTLSPTQTSTFTQTFTVTNTFSPTPTASPTVTFTVTLTPTFTLSATSTNTPTLTFSPTLTLTPTATFTRTMTLTPTITFTPTITNTALPTATPTPTCPSPLFPNPVDFTANHRPTLCGGSNCVVFDCLKPGSILKIYTVALSLVKEYDGTGPTQTWDGTNGESNPVSAGIYFYVIQDPSGNKTIGKFAVARGAKANP